MAQSSAIRSTDLSRQIGAVITKNKEILTYGANECPKYGGGIYYPEMKFDPDSNKYEIGDIYGGKDHTVGYDSNKEHINLIYKNVAEVFIDNGKLIHDKDMNREELSVEICRLLSKTRIKDITEFGKIVHAEMEALSMAARNNISVKDGVLYCTTFPCHNCAKHLIASGIKEVIYIEPYSKSKTLDLYGEDSVNCSMSKNELKDERMEIKHYTGIAPKKYYDLFSLQLSSGTQLKRKDKNKIIEWSKNNSKVRLKSYPYKEGIIVAEYINKMNIGVDYK